VKTCADHVSRELDTWNGCAVELKPLGFAVHYRRASASIRERVISELPEMARPLLEDGRMELRWGDEVGEIRPANIDKGRAVRELVQRLGDGHRHPVYIGNDHTDEDAFTELLEIGTTVQIGKTLAESSARFLGAGPGWVREFLEACVGQRRVANES
jgi:trehalose-phosphatase